MTFRFWKHSPDRLSALILLAGIAGLYIVGLSAIWSNQWILPIGDCTVRALSALTDKLEFSDLFSDIGLRSPWPRGHQLLIGSITRWLASGSDSFGAVHWYQTVSWTAYIAGILLFAAVAKALYGPRSALATLVSIISIPIGFIEAASGMTEIYVFFLAGCSMLAVTIGLRRNSVWLLFVGALANVLASTMRTEVILIAFIQWLVLIGRVRIFPCLVFGVMSAGYFLVRLFYSAFIYQGPVTFLNSNKTLMAPDATGKTFEMFRAFSGNFGSLLTALSIFAIFVGIWRLLIFLRQPRFGNADLHSKPLPVTIASAYKLVVSLWKSSIALPYLPIYCLSILILFMVMGLRSGNLEALPRYWIVPMPYFCLVGAALFSKHLEIDNRVFRLGSYLILLLLGTMSVRNLAACWQKRERFQPRELEFIEWLSNQPKRGAVFDFMGFRDGRYIVYASRPGSRPLYWGRGTPDPFGIKLEKTLSENIAASKALNTRRSAQASLLQKECAFLILANKSLFDRTIRKQLSSKRSSQTSYFRNDIRPLNSSGTIVHFKSSALNESPELTLQLVYSNSLVDVFEKVDGDGEHYLPKSQESPLH